MGSWCDLAVDGFSMHGSKSYVDDITLSVFHERDRRVRPDPDDRDGEEIHLRYEYATSAQAMRERLDTLGFTAKRARTDYANGHAEDVESAEHSDWLPESERQQLRCKTYDYWCAAIGRLVPLGFQTGRSDTRVLSAAIEAMVPHLGELFGFLDFEGMKLQGSTDTLAKTVRAFVGARVSTRLVAIFDNDTAGVAALTSLADVRLPPNIRTIVLPRSAVGSDYPTTGPPGVSQMDVNGMACSIELYLGRDALSDGAGALRPVRWTGWDPKMGRYQGAIGARRRLGRVGGGRGTGIQHSLAALRSVSRWFATEQVCCNPSD